MSGEGANAALSRLSLLARLTANAGADAVVRELVAASVELVLHVVRAPDGTVKINSIEEVVGYSDAGFETQVLFHQKDAGFAATGTVPRFYTELAARGIAADQAVFR
jgi:pilus assembly protein CpaF